MPMITISFNYPQAPLPRYKFGDRVAVTSDCQPCDWLTGKIVGLILDENYQPCWYYSLKLDAPSGLTEEYLGDDLVSEKQIPVLQSEWEEGEAAWFTQSRQDASKQKVPPKFKPGMHVRFRKNSRCNLEGENASVLSSRFVSGDDWSGWVYQLTNEHVTEPIEIGEYWLEAIACTTGAEGNQSLADIESG